MGLEEALKEMEEERGEWMSGINEDHLKQMKKLEDDKKEIRFFEKYNFNFHKSNFDVDKSNLCLFPTI